MRLLITPLHLGNPILLSPSPPAMPCRYEEGNPRLRCEKQERCRTVIFALGCSTIRSFYVSEWEQMSSQNGKQNGRSKKRTRATDAQLYVRNGRQGLRSWTIVYTTEKSIHIEYNSSYDICVACPTNLPSSALLRLPEPSFVNSRPSLSIDYSSLPHSLTSMMLWCYNIYI